MVYLYCITDAGISDLASFNAKKIRLFDFGSFRVVAADPKDFEPASPRCVMEHYEINDHILRNGFTVLPFAYGTVIPFSDVSYFIRNKHESIVLNLDRFRGKAEMGVKVLISSQKEQTEDLFKRLGDTPGHRYLSRRLEKYAPLFAGSGTIQALRRDIDKFLGSVFSGFKIKISSRAWCRLGIWTRVLWRSRRSR
ncbi:MAG: GvpL/GvpF family gas vesicle protein [Bryobacteraceae bacterium]|nr:GvpL/GvpF family gas vesicle protein [Bryobacteraceae bacterium]